mmetsp:Transcript_3373/g.7816  ORF Transcript_3373/g.7816 Transcript_3373/m.7816 type:complete len:253 (+) Transcript_3373:711-1469(+)
MLVRPPTYLFLGFVFVTGGSTLRTRAKNPLRSSSASPSLTSASSPDSFPSASQTPPPPPFSSAALLPLFLACRKSSGGGGKIRANQSNTSWADWSTSLHRSLAAGTPPPCVASGSFHAARFIKPSTSRAMATAAASGAAPRSTSASRPLNNCAPCRSISRWRSSRRHSGPRYLRYLPSWPWPSVPPLPRDSAWPHFTSSDRRRASFNSINLAYSCVKLLEMMVMGRASTRTPLSMVSEARALPAAVVGYRSP